MEEINRFVSLAATGRFSFTELCLDFKVSLKTGYKWWRRYRAEGRTGLQPRSHRTGHCPHQTALKIGTIQKGHAAIQKAIQKGHAVPFTFLESKRFPDPGETLRASKAVTPRACSDAARQTGGVAC